MQALGVLARHADTWLSPKPVPEHHICAVMYQVQALVRRALKQTAHMRHAGQGSGSKKPEHLPRVRWYDARVRTALRKVASWLNVPWPAVGNFEHLLAYQVPAPLPLTLADVMLCIPRQALTPQQGCSQGKLLLRGHACLFLSWP